MAVSQEAQSLMRELYDAMDVVLVRHGYKNTNRGSYGEYPDKITSRIVLEKVNAATGETDETTTILRKFNYEMGETFVWSDGKTYRITGIRRARRTRNNPDPYWILAEAPSGKIYKFIGAELGEIKEGKLPGSFRLRGRETMVIGPGDVGNLGDML